METDSVIQLAALGGAFGIGELPRLLESYRSLCANWANGDRVIDIVGFSRGAATTLDFCHIIQKRGIRRPGPILPHRERLTASASTLGRRIPTRNRPRSP